MYLFFLIFDMHFYKLLFWIDVEGFILQEGFMLDELYKFFLSFVHNPVLLPLIIIGYIWLDRRIFFHAASILLLGMLVNGALKYTFRIPLSPSIGKTGFAFPSGHMQTSVTFYGWIFDFTNKYIIKAGIIVIFFGMGLGLMHFNYHDMIDVLGGIACAIFLIKLYKYLLKKYGDEKLSLISIIISTLLILYIYAVDGIRGHSFMAYYSLIGFSISEILLKNRQVDLNNTYKIIATLFCILLLYTSYSFIKIPSDKIFISEIKWVIISSAMSLSTYIAGLIQKKFYKISGDEI